MSFSRFIAFRYFFSKRNRNAVNIITGISLLGFTVGSAALIIVLSVFNGFESLVLSLYNSFDPDIKITLNQGKVFNPQTLNAALSKYNGIEVISYSLEENAGLKFGDNQTVATIKGVSKEFNKVSGIDTLLIEGDYSLSDNDLSFACVGYGIAYRLALNTYAPGQFLGIYVPKRTAKGISINPEESLNSSYVMPTGVFSVEEEINNKYVIIPLALAQKLLDYKNEISAIEIKLKKGLNENKAAEEIQKIVGPAFNVKTRYQQQEILYTVFKSERLVTFLILSFIVLIATFNIIGSLIMLVIDKKPDIKILRSLGASSTQIQKIFFYEGLIITLFGSLAGLLIGIGFVFLQDQFGFIGIGGNGSFIISAYPVKLKLTDAFLVLATVLTIGSLTSIWPARMAAKLKV